MPQILETAIIENNLRLDGQQPCGKLEWLEESYRDSGSFWQSLKQAYDVRFAVHGVSSIFGKYNFYYDIVVRNVNNPSPALYWHDPVSGFRNISYRELGSMAAAKAASWVRSGLKPGQTLCIIRNLCLDLIVETIAALKLGCIISFLPLQGRGFLQRRLEALQPDFIASDPLYLSKISEWTDKILMEGAPREDVPFERERSFTYSTGQTVFICFDPRGHETIIPSEITSDSAYLCALRDGIISLGLGSGQVYTAPGFHCMESYPGLLLAGLLCGATYLHLTPKAIAENPEIVVEKQIKAFGVSKKVRDILLEKPVEVGSSWECWFRNPAESADLEQWYYFVRSLKLEKSYAFNLRWDAALGGCSLFSVRRKGTAHMNVLPVPGSVWCLSDLSGGGNESSTDIGAFTFSAPSASEKEKRATCDIIAKNRQEWIFAGISTSHREGRNFPFQEILDSLRTMGSRYAFFCSFVDAPRVDPSSGNHIILLVFRGAKRDFNEARLSSEIRSSITQEMGDEFQPDRIDFFPLYPRFLADMEMDHQWCRSQYFTGSLSRRSRGEIFQCITRLRGCIMRN
ncbi:MAG: hypothetical protein ABFD82_05035 [Syntrophaceae bacterium]